MSRGGSVLVHSTASDEEIGWIGPRTDRASSCSALYVLPMASAHQFPRVAPRTARFALLGAALLVATSAAAVQCLQPAIDYETWNLQVEEGPADWRFVVVSADGTARVTTDSGEILYFSFDTESDE